MEVNLESLIEKIKKDGIEEAKRNGEEIVNAARKQSQEMLERAKKEAAGIISGARNEAEKLTRNSQAALQQAGRDLVLSLRQELAKVFDEVLKKKVDAELDGDFLKDIIAKFVMAWAEKKDASIEVLLNKNDAKKLEGVLVASLKKEAAKTIEIRVSKTLAYGFRIGVKGSDVYYDFSDEAILEALKVFLNPATSQLLDSDNG